MFDVGRGLLAAILCLACAPGVRAQADAGATRFATQMDRAVAASDGAAIEALIDVDAFLDKAMQGLEAPAERQRSFRDGVKSAFHIGQAIVDELKQGGSYRLLRTRPGPDGRPRVLFRLLTGGAVNYHEFALGAAGASGVPRAADLYVFVNGEWFSEAFRRGWLMVVADSGLAGTLQRLVGVEGAYVKALPDVRALQELVRQGKPAQALAAYARLPREVQADKGLSLLRVMAAQKVGDKEYFAAVDDFQKRFPTDAALDLLLLDTYFGRQDWTGCLGVLERLETRVGGDAYIDFLRGNVHYSRKDFPVAKAAYARAVATEPTLAEPYWSALTISLEEKSFDETARLLTAVERDAKLALNDIAGVPAYAEFVRSDAYKKWKKSRAARP